MRFSFPSGIRIAVVLLPAFLISGVQASMIDQQSLITSYPLSFDRKAASSTSENLFWFYDTFVSPIDGERCRMSPSCSHYSRQAIKKRGWLKGILMTLDRLQRCGYDLIDYPRRYDDGIERFYDPVEPDTGPGKGNQ